MESALEFLQSNLLPVGAAASTLLLSYLLINRKTAPKPYKPGVVILHQFPRTHWIPNVSPFCIKLETFLKVNQIPYEVAKGFQFSSKQKMPWIELDGCVYEDSHFILLHLSKRFNIDLDSHLTTEQKAVSVAFQRMLEEHLYFAVAHTFYKHSFPEVQSKLNRNFGERLFGHIIKRSILKMTYAQGVGRHTDEEVNLVSEEDLGALSVLLAEKSFMFGNEGPSSLDIVAFSALAGVCAIPFETPQKKLIEQKFPNLARYVERLKGVYWADWEEVLAK